MMPAIENIATTIRQNWLRLIVHGLSIALLYQLVMLLALIVRFQALPNYIHFYDWIGSIIHIVASTPSWSDIFSIAREEWLIEIGQMNYDYGTGLSIWSLNVIPSRLIILTIMGAMISLGMIMAGNKTCTLSTRSANATIFGGSLLVAITNATMSWVVCCATPSWVVGLAMLGLSVSLSLALESLGTIISVVGFTLLVAGILLLGWRNSRTLTARQPDLHTASRHA